MHYDMLKFQDGVIIGEKFNYSIFVKFQCLLRGPRSARCLGIHERYYTLLRDPRKA